MNLGRKTPHHIPERGGGSVSCTFHLSMTAEHSIKSVTSRVQGACDRGERRCGQWAGWEVPAGALRDLGPACPPRSVSARTAGLPGAPTAEGVLRGGHGGPAAPATRWRLAQGPAPALRPRHYFGWSRPRPHLRRPGSAGSGRVAAPRTRAASRPQPCPAARCPTPTRPPPSTSLPTRAAWASSASEKVWPERLSASCPHRLKFWAGLPTVLACTPLRLN